MWKKFGTSSICSTPVKYGLATPPVDKLRKQAVRTDAFENEEVECSAIPFTKIMKTKARTKPSHNAKPSKLIVKTNLPGNHSFSKNTSGQKVMKVSHTVQSVSISCLWYFYLQNLDDNNFAHYIIFSVLSRWRGGCGKSFKERLSSMTEKVVHGKGHNVGLKKGPVLVASKMCRKVHIIIIALF